MLYTLIYLNGLLFYSFFFFFSSRRRHTRFDCDWSSDVCSSDLSRGGAALSVRHVTGRPIAFVGMGEKTDALEPFHPDRLASRILGMGDILSLVEKAQQNVDQAEAEAMVKKLREETFTLEDFRPQL